MLAKCMAWQQCEDTGGLVEPHRTRGDIDFAATPCTFREFYAAVLGHYVKWRSRRRRWWWVLITKCQRHHALSITTDQYHSDNIHDGIFSTPKRCSISHWLGCSHVLPCA